MAFGDTRIDSHLRFSIWGKVVGRMVWVIGKGEIH